MPAPAIPPRAPVAIRRAISGAWRFSAIGDSISSDAVSITGQTSINWTHWGYLSWFRRFMGSKIDFPASRNYAAAGVKVSDLLTGQLASAVSDASNIVVCMVGTNSIGVEADLTMQSELTTVYGTLRAAGKIVLAIPVRAHNAGFAFSAQQLKQVGRLNRWIYNYCLQNDNMLFFSMDPTILDYSTGLAQAAYLRDGLHDNLISAKLQGQALATYISALIPDKQGRFNQLGDIYDATYNPGGNLLTNGLLAGSGGTLVNGATGASPTGWRIYRSSGGATATLAGSLTAYSGVVGLNYCTMTFGGTGDGSLGILDQQFTAATVGVNVGDLIFAECEVTWNFTTAGFTGIELQVQAQSAGFAQLAITTDGAYNSGNGSFAASDTGSMTLRTDPFIVPASTIYIDPALQVVTPVGGGAITGVVNVAKMALRKYGVS